LTEDEIGQYKLTHVMKYLSDINFCLAINLCLYKLFLFSCFFSKIGMGFSMMRWLFLRCGVVHDTMYIRYDTAHKSASHPVLRIN